MRYVSERVDPGITSVLHFSFLIARVSTFEAENFVREISRMKYLRQFVLD